MKEEEIEQIRFILESLSELGSRVMITELQTALRMLGYNPSEDDLRKCEEIVDPKKRGSFKMDQFVQLIDSGTIKKDVNPSQILDGALQTFDSEGKGIIEMSVLEDALTKMGDKLSNEEFKAFLEYADPGESGKVRIQDFVGLITSDLSEG